MTESSEPEKKKASPERRDERIRPWNTLTPFSSESKKVFGFRGTGQIDLFLVSTKLPHTHTTPAPISFVFCLLSSFSNPTNILSLSLSLSKTLSLSVSVSPSKRTGERNLAGISPIPRRKLRFFFFFFTTPNFSGRGNSLFKN
jgi:hypothetical protein